MIARDITDRKRADELERQNVYLREAFETDLHFGEIHGRSAVMQEVFKAISSSPTPIQRCYCSATPDR